LTELSVPPWIIEWTNTHKSILYFIFMLDG
jgi:hypothetical protein